MDSNTRKKISENIIASIIVPVFLVVIVVQIYPLAVFCYMLWGEQWQLLLGFGISLSMLTSGLFDLKPNDIYSLVSILVYAISSYFTNPIIGVGVLCLWRLVCLKLQRKH